GHRQEKGIDYDEVFPPIARIEAIRLFLAYASFMNFNVYQIDVKSAFLYGTIEEEVYVSQPLGFLDPQFLDKVYQVEKALYGLHQAPRAWYETLSNYLLENGFITGTIDKTLFIKKIKNDIVLVQVYVDDIIFGSTKRSLRIELKGYFLNDGYADLVQHPDKKELDIPEQMTTGKEFSNPLMAGSLLKTISAKLQLSIYSNLPLHINKKKTQTCRRTQKDTELPQTSVLIKHEADEAVNQEEGDGGIDTGGRPRRQQTMGGTSAQTRYERVLKQFKEPPLTEGHTSRSEEGILEENIELMNIVPTPHDSPLTGGYTPESDEGRIRLAELMETCIILSNRVTQLETELLTTKVVYNKAFITLTNRVKKLESQLKQKRSKAVIYSSDEEGPSMRIEDSPKQGRIIEEMDKDENINLKESSDPVTQEDFIGTFADNDGDERRQSALLRLALNDVVISLFLETV
nr:copia protein [Tanacetum cinerariifolium]